MSTDSSDGLQKTNGEPPPAAAEDAVVQAMAADGEEESEAGFSSRWAFWISAIGSSVGFGNIWRFPYLVWEYGGGAFFIPYVISLIVVALPVVSLEFGLGQLAHGGQNRAYRSVHPRAASMVFSITSGFFVMCYYPLLLSWSLIMLGHSCKKEMPWAVSDVETEFCQTQTDSAGCLSNIACRWDSGAGTCDAYVLNKAIYFFEVTLMAKPDFWTGFNAFNWQALICELGTFVLVALACIGGARILGYVNYFTTAAPGVILIVLVGVGCSLDGAVIGVKQYLGKFDVSLLKNSSIWVDACTQSLFSASATQGCMSGYASHNPRSQNFMCDSYVVLVGDLVYAVIAGFAVFAVTGYMSKSSGIPLEDLDLNGVGLAFQTYPVGLAEGIPYPGAQIVSFLFFLTLWLLGVSTAVSIIEALCVNFYTTKHWQEKGWPRWPAYVVTCAVLALVHILWCTDMGLTLLDSLDTYLNAFGFLFYATAETTIVGWYAAYDLYIERAGKAAVYTHGFTWVFGMLIGSVVGFSAPPSVGKIAGPVIGVVICVGGWIAGYCLTKDTHHETGEKLTCGDRMFNLTIYNIGQLRLYMNSVACQERCCCNCECKGCCELCHNYGCCVMPWAGAVLIKYLSSGICTILFVSLITDRESTFSIPGGVGGVNYQWWVLFIGFIGPITSIFLALLFFLWPEGLWWFEPNTNILCAYPDAAPKQLASAAAVADGKYGKEGGGEDDATPGTALALQDPSPEPQDGMIAGQEPAPFVGQS